MSLASLASTAAEIGWSNSFPTTPVERLETRSLASKAHHLEHLRSFARRPPAKRSQRCSAQPRSGDAPNLQVRQQLRRHPCHAAQAGRSQIAYNKLHLRAYPPVPWRSPTLRPSHWPKSTSNQAAVRKMNAKVAGVWAFELDRTSAAKR